MRHLVVPILLALIVAGCGPNNASSGDARKIEIEMRDFTFSPETLTLRAGERVMLTFKNIGKVEHEFMAGNEPTVGKGYLKDWFTGTDLASGGGHGMDHSGSGVRVAANSTRTITFVVPSQSGLFEFGCFVSSHYEFGMRGRLVVDVQASPSSAPTGERTGSQRPPAPAHAPMGDDDGEGH